MMGGICPENNSILFYLKFPLPTRNDEHKRKKCSLHFLLVLCQARDSNTWSNTCPRLRLDSPRSRLRLHPHLRLRQPHHLFGPIAWPNCVVVSVRLWTLNRAVTAPHKAVRFRGKTNWSAKKSQKWESFGACRRNSANKYHLCTRAQILERGNACCGCVVSHAELT